MTCMIAALFLAANAAPLEVAGEQHMVRLQVGRSLVLRTKDDVHRTAIAAEGIVELSQFTPREIMLIGRGVGTTTVTFWLRDASQPPVIYALEVVDRASAP
jgi:Flp pilus assembly secretin CpaC